MNTRILKVVGINLLGLISASADPSHLANDEVDGHRASHRAGYTLPTSSASVGTPSIVWYTTWETALAEAQRSHRPIFFMAAAAQCGDIPGVF